MSKRLAALAAALLCSTSAHAQTVIVPDTDPGKATGTQVTTSGSTTTIDGGAQAGANLFHSFAQFGLDTGDTAAWTFTFGDPNSIANVINRVTGGGSSFIDGTIDSTGLPNAAFFFINPAGVIFGENAQVNVPGAAHFSTASHLDFADGARFSAVAPDGSTFTMASPASFGFFGDEAALRVFGNAASVPLAISGSLSFSAAEIGIYGRTIDADGIALTATGGAPLDVSVEGVNYDAQLADGRIELFDSELFSGAGSAIAFAAGDLLLANSVARTLAPDGADGGAILAGAGSIVLEGSALATRTEGAGAAGEIMLVGDEVIVTGGSVIGSRTLGEGAGGAITIETGSLEIFESGIGTVSGPVDDADAELGDAGVIAIRAASVLIQNGQIDSASLGRGGVGGIGISAGELELESGSVVIDNLGSSPITAQVTIDGGSISLAKGSLIASNSDGQAATGAVIVTADLIEIDGSTIASNANGAGESGGILLQAEQIRLINGAQLESNARSTGFGGFVGLVGSDILIADSSINTLAFDEGNAGVIGVEADNLAIVGASIVLTRAEGIGQGGGIAIELTGGLFIGDEAVVSSEGLGPGLAGFVDITSASVEISGNGRLGSNSFGAGDGGFIGISTGVFTMDGGNVEIAAVGAGNAGSFNLLADQVLLANGAVIISDTFGSGDGGFVSIEAAEFISIGAGATIFSNSQGTGDAGFITLAAPLVDIGPGGAISSNGYQSGAAGFVDIIAADFVMNQGQIALNAFAGGDAGYLTASADRVLLDGFSSITNTTFGDGDSGFIEINASERIALLDFSRIESDTNGAGIGGGILLTAPVIDIIGSSLTSSASSSGDAGAIMIDAGEMTILEQSSISSSSTASGNAGFIDIAAGSLSMDAAEVESAAILFSTGDAGAINISVSGTFSLDNQSVISTGTGIVGGRGGAIDIRAASLELRNGSLIESDTSRLPEGSVFQCSEHTCTAIPPSGDPTGGDVNLVADSVLVDSGSRISASTNGVGAGGSVEITADLIEVGHRAAIATETAGAGDAGTLVLNSGTVRVDGGRIASSVVLALGADFDDPDAEELDDSDIFEDEDNPPAPGDPFDRLPFITGNAGNVIINAGTLEVLAGGTIASNAISTGDAGTITIDVGQALLEGGSVTATTSGSGAAGQIGLSADSFTLTGGATISSETTADGAAGLVSFTGGALIVLGASTISSSTSGAGDAGGVFVRADAVVLDSEGRITSSTSGSGNAGFVDIGAASLSIGLDAKIVTETLGAGAAGQVFVAADTLSMAGGFISSDAQDGSSGDAGEVFVSGSDLTLTELSFIRSNSFGSGKAGTVDVTADTLTVTDSFIDSEAYGTGDAGDVAISARDITLISGTFSSTSFGQGDAGTVSVTADSLFAQFALINTDAVGEGPTNAGDVAIQVTGPIVFDQSFASSSAGDGNSGRVTVTAGSLAIDNFGGILTASSGAGRSGDIVVDADTIVLTNEAYINSDTTDGAGGSIAVNAAESIELSGLASITASTSGAGDAGKMSIATPSLSLQNARIEAESRGSGAAGEIDLFADVVHLANGSTISSNATSTGRGGLLLFFVGDLIVETGSSIASSTIGAGRAGGILLFGGDIDLRDGATVSARAEPGSTGDAGVVAVIADTLSLGRGATISSSTAGAGDAGGELSRDGMLVNVFGGVLIEVDKLAIAGGLITSSSEPGATGRSGLVEIVSEEIAITDGGAIETLSDNSLIAGRIDIDTASLLVEGANSRISSSNTALSEGDAGDIAISADAITIREGGSIATNSVAGAAGNIGLTLPPGSLVRLEGRNSPATITTSSGPGTGGVITIASPLAIISEGGIIRAQGEQGGAKVQIRSQFYIDAADTLDLILVDGDFTFDGQLDYVASGEEPRDVSLLDAGAVLSGRCRAAQSGGGSSQLGIAPIGPYGTLEAPAATDSVALLGDVASLASLQTAGPCG